MLKVIKYLTFIPWILYFIEIMLYRIGVIETHKLDKDTYFKHIKENLFKSSINVKEAILFVIFILFKLSKNTPVLETLFATFYIFLLLDFFQTLAYDCKKIKYKSLMVQSVILVVLIIGFFTFTNKLYTTYTLMFLVSLSSSFIIYGFSLVTNILKPKSLKK